MFLWIWNIRKLGTPQQIIDRLKALHCNDVCIKYHDGSAPINFRDDFLEYMTVLKAAGIRVGAWGYNYFNYPDAEAALIKEALYKGADYYIFDGEGEIEGKASQAESVLQQVRAAYSSALLGYAPFPYIKYHLSYPYKVFDKYCNFATPQSYNVSIGTSLDSCLKNTLQYFKETALTLPIYPSIEAYKVGDYSPIKVFANYGLWDLDSMDNACESFLGNRNIQQVQSQTQSQNIKPQVNEGVRQLQSNLNLLHIANLATDGITGPLTIAAIKKFQSIMGLTTDGIAGPITQGAISQILSRPLDGVIYPHYEYATRYIQWRVGASIDGVFGNETAIKVKIWQVPNNLFSDGIVGIKSWSKLI